VSWGQTEQIEFWGRDLIFKVTGEDTGGTFDCFIVEVAPRGGPPLHVHHKQEETIHILKGRYKIRIGEDIFYCEPGGFAYLPSKERSRQDRLNDRLHGCRQIIARLEADGNLWEDQDAAAAADLL
jgi:mannose-6-phosphate isomerase-like protein (cupin superfamily)